jgi:hypothetical protein
MDPLLVDDEPKARTSPRRDVKYSEVFAKISTVAVSRDVVVGLVEPKLR